MVYNLLSDSAKTRTVPISESVLYAILGFAIVFVGILFLIFVVWVVGKFMSKSKKNEKKTEKPIVKKEKQEVAPSLAVADATEEITEETIAVITAAIMAYYQKNKPKCEFTVKRIKRF